MSGGIMTGPGWNNYNQAGGIVAGGDPMQNFVGEIVMGGGYAARAGCPTDNNGFALRQPPGQAMSYTPFTANADGGRRFPLGGFGFLVTAAAPSQTVANQPQLPFRSMSYPRRM